MVNPRRIAKRLISLHSLIIAAILPSKSQPLAAHQSIEWSIDNLTKIGGYSVAVFGNPAIREFSDGKAMLFDGIDDGLIVQGCPINNSSEFTVEIIFRPDSSFPTNVEQRFLHIQKPTLESRRMLLELRLNGNNKWIVDTHIRSDSVWLTSLAKEHPHPVGRWYHLALVYRNGVATHYVDGIKEMSGNINYIPLDSAHVSLGMRMNQRSFFRGAIKTVRMTSCALQPSEFKPFISQSMNLDKHSAMELLFSEDFEVNSSNWISELEQPSTSSVAISNGKLAISTSAGATVWFREKLSGNVMIMYDAFVTNDGRMNDRVSDLNAFWMATDHQNDNLFTRNGKFSSYDNLNLYYCGIGGHDNTTTRFRKYHSNGTKPVLQEYLDKNHLLDGNTLYKIMIVVREDRIQFYRNDEPFFDYSDSRPYREGYFAFRTTKSHQLMDNFKVYRLSGE